MKKKLDPLFALSVLVLVLGIFSLACSWVPFRCQRSESNNVARAETTSSGSISNSDFIIGTSTDVKYWRSATPLVSGGYIDHHVIGYMVKGLPKVSDFSVLSSSTPFQYEVIISFSGLVNGTATVVTSNLVFTNYFYEQPISAFQLDLTGSNDDLDLNIYTDQAFTGSFEGLNQFRNKSFSSRFCVFDYSSPVSVSYTFKDTGVEVTSETMSEDYRQFLSIVNDCVAFSPVDFASYGDYLLNSQGGTDPDLQQKYVDLQKKYQDLLYDYSLVAPAGTAIVQWGTTFKFSPVFGETSLPADNTVFYEGYYKFGSSVKTLGNEVFYDVSASMSTDKKAWYPSSLSAGKYVCFGLPFNYVMAPNITASYVFSSPVVTQMMLGVYDSERKTVYFRAFLNNVSNVSFSAFDYRTSNENDRIVFYGFVEDSNAVATDFLVPTGVDTLHITISAGQNSYDSGFNAGVISVKQQYEARLQAERENARQKGFSEAQKMFDNGNTDYSFFGLISAVIDAPIKAIRGLLNFDILGVNMFSFVTSLFSLAVVLMIVKLVLGTRDVV